MFIWVTGQFLYPGPPWTWKSIRWDVQRSWRRVELHILDCWD